MQDLQFIIDMLSKNRKLLVDLLVPVGLRKIDVVVSYVAQIVICPISHKLCKIMQGSDYDLMRIQSCFHHFADSINYIVLGIHKILLQNNSVILFDKLCSVIGDIVYRIGIDCRRSDLKGLVFKTSFLLIRENRNDSIVKILCGKSEGLVFIFVLGVLVVVFVRAEGATSGGIVTAASRKNGYGDDQKKKCANQTNGIFHATPFL